MKYSIWYVVEAINRLPQFAIKYPSDHSKQLAIAAEFREKSQVGFSGCAGAIDGVLVWIHKPSLTDSLLSTCDPGKFYCSRKSKFGLNCQAVSDARGRILDISIKCPGSASDLFAFENSTLCKNLETKGFLAEGLCLFGDNAYVNKPYMATPFLHTTSGPRDSYNFFHSQLRIRVECCFGILTRRWGILRSAIPCGVSLFKTTRLVVALAKLHNFCIDENEIVTPHIPRDELNIRSSDSGSVPMEVRAGTRHEVPAQLIGAGHHFGDIPAHLRRSTRADRLPRDLMLEHVIRVGMTRPRPSPR